MALVIHQEPQELTPAYNKQIFVALSDQIAVADFKYVVTVIVNGDSANTYTEDILQRPDGHMVFNAQQWVQNYIEHYFDPTDTGIVIATNKSVSVEVNISEYYTATIQSTTTVFYCAFDACLTEDEFADYDFEDYLFGENTNKYLLSKAGINEVDTLITPTQDVWLHFFNGITDPVTDIVVEVRNTGGVVVGGFSSSMPTPDLAYDMFAVNVGNQTGAVAGYTVRVEFNGAGGLIKRFTLTLAEPCANYTDYILYYLDRHGAIQFKHFEKLSTKSYTKKTNEVYLEKDTLNTTTHQYGSNIWDRNKHTISTAIESLLILNSNWITPAQSILLVDCWASPIKYLKDTSRLKSITMMAAPYEEKKSRPEPLFNYTVTVDLGSAEGRQRGL